MKNLKKMTLVINGVDRMFICDPENDKLSDILRRIGLTGVKVGCGKGVCGACSVILDGKVIRSCTKKITAVSEYSEITTIEGIGAPGRLHPLQLAWMTNGAVQCGFCVPGFIVSAYQLLKEKISPTREEVRDWFQKHRNICRCTGYKQIVDAVMDAAAILRGEKSLEDIEYKDPVDKKYYGTKIIRPSALGKVTGLTDYGDDIELKMPSETIHVALVQPKLTHHAKIKKIDTKEAEKMPGVVKIITAKNISKYVNPKAFGTNRLMFFEFLPRTIAKEKTHALIAEDKIINYGAVIALACADTKERARAAAAKVTVEYEELPSILNYLDAALPDAYRVHDDHPNIWAMQPTVKLTSVEDSSKISSLIDKAPHIVEGSFYSSREPHMPIEGDTVQAYFDEDDNLTVHCKAMAIYTNIGDIAEATGLPPEKIRVIENPTGGTFGWGTGGASFALAGLCCIALDKRPIALSMTYEEFMAYSGKRAPAYSNSRLACDEKGKIIAAEFEFGIDHGAYNELGDDLTTRTARFTYFPYNVPNVLGLSRVATTNHAYGVAYRGYGSPQAYTCSEAMIDMMAEELKMDPFEFRRLNTAQPGDTNINQYEFKDYPMNEILDRMEPFYRKALAGKEQFNKRSDGKIKRGVGIVWGGYNVTEGTADQCTVAIELSPDNTFIKYDTWQDQGQGGDIGSLMVTLEALRIHFDGIREIVKEDVKLIQNDSKYCPDHGASASSRSHFMNGKATYKAVEKLKNAMLKSDGTLRTYDEMIAEKISLRYEHQFLNSEWGTEIKNVNQLADLDPNTGKGDPTPDYTYAMFLAVVDVDMATGKATVQKYFSVDDVGVVGNIDAVNGQVFGGASHCIGFALSENYDDVKKHSNILGAGIPTIKDVPDDIGTIHLENRRRQNEFGSSGASEAFQSSGHVAVINAIYNATGVRIYDLPATKEKIKEGIDRINRGEKISPPKKYFLGSDFYEEMENIRKNPIETEE
ncbi:MAG: molybdopterin-dependent oxidoreductase [Clostridiales Family XIII bacterium]|jgi:aldehyde oxidoreductase|nr:molybdopterin-dependent oxidoreductase [Clostridiales Family XIII bacterium]